MNTENLVLIKKLRKELHQCPELAGQEYKTKNVLMEFIRKHTTFKIVDKEKWFYVFYDESATETIGFRADMDAVHTPGGEVKHVCGHDGHSASLAGLVLEVYNKSKGYKFGKNVCFIFQFGEETGEGGKVCSEAVTEVNIDTIYAYHNIPGFFKGAVLIKENTFACTSKGMILHFSGAPTHAAYPEYGRNPSIPIGDILSQLPAIADPVLYKGMILCTVIGVHVGSRAFGVAASEGEILLTIRGEYESDMLKLQENLHDRANKLAKSKKLELIVKYCDEFPETVNNNNCIRDIKEKCDRNKIPVVELKEPFRWSEDFGYYLKKCRGAMIGIGNGEESEQLHTAEYEFSDDILERAVDTFYTFIL